MALWQKAEDRRKKEIEEYENKLHKVRINSTPRGILQALPFPSANKQTHTFTCANPRLYGSSHTNTRLLLRRWRRLRASRLGLRR